MVTCFRAGCHGVTLSGFLDSWLCKNPPKETVLQALDLGVKTNCTVHGFLADANALPPLIASSTPAEQ